jgi:hypothetical protein
MKYLVSTLIVVTFAGLCGFAYAENGATLSPDEIVQLLKERAKPFENFQLDTEHTGRNVIPERTWARERFGYKEEPHPEGEIKYESRTTLMVKGTQVTFENEFTSQKSTIEGISINDKRKWSNAAGHVRELTTSNGELIMSLCPLERHSSGASHAEQILLTMGVGIGRIIESIESIQKEQNGDMTVKATVSLRGFKNPCTMRLNKDYFPLQISIVITRNESLQELYEVHIDEVAKVDGHWYGKVGKFVDKEELKTMLNPEFRFKIFADYAYKVSDFKLSVSDEEFDKFSSMPITPGMHVSGRLAIWKDALLNPLPDLPPVP